MQPLLFVVFPLRHLLELCTKHSLGGPTRKNPTDSNQARLMWAGHVVRMEQHRIPKKVIGNYFGGQSPVGR
jgi:hypothetical protein